LRPSRANLTGLIVGALGAFALSSCSTGGGAAGQPTTTTTRLPPDLVGLVALIGTGPNEGTGSTVAALDLTNTAKPSRSITVGGFPDAIAIAPHRHMAYVTNYQTNNVTPIDLRTGKVGRSLAAGTGPAGIAISPDEKTAYVTDAGGSPIGNTVTPINLKTGRAGKAIVVGAGPQGIAITPDGRHAYVADAGAIVTGQTGAIGHSVTPIDLKTGRALAPITVGNAPVAIVISADGSTGYVANEYSGSVTPFSTANDTALTPIEMSGSPQALAIAPNGSSVWVANAPSSVSPGNNLTPIDVSSATAGKPVALPKGPTSLAITPDGATAWIVCYGANAVVPVNLSSAVVETADEVSVPGGPYALALTNEDKVLAIPKVKKPVRSR
jgi:DNA-binding beta-propeller fold protein YncE